MIQELKASALVLVLSGGCAMGQNIYQSDVTGLDDSTSASDTEDSVSEEAAAPAVSVAGTSRSTASGAYPIGAVAGGWGYIWADQGNGERSNINGWFLKPSYNITKNWSVYLDFSNYYGKNSRGAINQHSYTAGVSRTFPVSAHFKPGVFVQSGDVRVSNAGRITHAFTFLTGASVTVPLKPWLAVSVIPAEYVFGYPNGQTRNSYNAKASFVFSFGHKGAKH